MCCLVTLALSEVFVSHIHEQQHICSSINVSKFQRRHTRVDLKFGSEWMILSSLRVP